MWLNRVVEVDKSWQADLTDFPIPKHLLLMPHLHEWTDHPFCLAVCLGTINPGKFLTNIEFTAGGHKCMFTGSFELFAVV